MEGSKLDPSGPPDGTAVTVEIAAPTVDAVELSDAGRVELEAARVDEVACAELLVAKLDKAVHDVGVGGTDVLTPGTTDDVVDELAPLVCANAEL